MKFILSIFIKFISLFKREKGREKKPEVPKDNYPMF
jgi:hypothetical protein